MKYAYINGKILDGTKDMQVKEGFVILTDNDKIEDIVKAGTDLNGYEKVDLKRRYIMPGLINMHVHLASNIIWSVRIAASMSPVCFWSNGRTHALL